jgi:hypothetical protein
LLHLRNVNGLSFDVAQCELSNQANPVRGAFNLERCAVVCAVCEVMQAGSPQTKGAKLMKYILLMFGFNMGDGVSLAAEFNSQSACESAIVAMTDRALSGSGYDSPFGSKNVEVARMIVNMSVCVPKGTTAVEEPKDG